MNHRVHRFHHLGHSIVSLVLAALLADCSQADSAAQPDGPIQPRGSGPDRVYSSCDTANGDMIYRAEQYGGYDIDVIAGLCKGKENVQSQFVAAAGGDGVIKVCDTSFGVVIDLTETYGGYNIHAHVAPCP